MLLNDVSHTSQGKGRFYVSLKPNSYVELLYHSETFLLFMLKNYWVGGGCLRDFSVSPSPLGTNLGFELGWIGLGLGSGGLGPGLDNNFFYYWVAIYS